MKISRRKILNFIVPTLIGSFFSGKTLANEKKEKSSDNKSDSQALQHINHNLMSSPQGYKFVGGFFEAEGKALAGLKGESLQSRILKRGQFDIETIPNQPQGIAGMVFGGHKNRIAIIGDQRGRIQVYASMNGLHTAQQIAMPYIEGTGVFHGPHQDRIVKFPCAGNEDDNLSPGLWFSTSKDGIPDVYLVSPLRYTDFDNPYQKSINSTQFKILLETKLIPESLQQTKSSTKWNTLHCWLKIFGISYDQEELGSVSGIFTTGSPHSNTNIKYSIDIANLKLLNAEKSNINELISIVGLKDMSNYSWSCDNLTKFAIEFNEDLKQIILYAKIPPRSEGSTFIPTRITYEQQIQIYHNQDNLNSEPKNIIYIEPSFILEDSHICRMQDGILKYTPGIVIRVTSEQNEQIDVHGFTKNDKQSFISNKFKINKKISIQKINNYRLKIDGAVPYNKYWNVYSPIDLNTGEQLCIVKIEEITDNGFIVKLSSKDGTGDYDINLLPKDSWFDLHVRPK